MNNEEIRAINELKIVASLAEGPLSIDQIAVVVGIGRRTAWTRVRSLVDDGRLTCVREMKNMGRRVGVIPALYAAAEEPKEDPRLDLERARKAAEALAQPAFRHWMDVALFGPAERRAA